MGCRGWSATSVSIRVVVSRVRTRTGSMWSWAATLWDARRATVSSGLKPASAMRARILSTESVGRGIKPSGETWESFDRPARNWRRGPPTQLLTATAPANWMLRRDSQNSTLACESFGVVQVTEGDVVPESDRTLLLHDLVETIARSVIGLNVGKGHDGAVCTIMSPSCSGRR